MSQWFCQIDGNEVGPLSQKQLVELVRIRRLKPTDFVRKDSSHWALAGSVKGLFAESPTGANSPPGSPAIPPTPPPQAGGTAKGNAIGYEATVDWARPGAASKDDGADHVFDEPMPTHESGATAIIRDLAPGSTLGNYWIEAVLGEGGMGVVLKAKHLRMDRTVALKVLRREATKSSLAVRRFQQEVRAAAKLIHNNIVTAYDADEVRGVHFLVMEFVEGASLADLLAKNGKFTVPDVIQYVAQAAHGLGYAHSQGIVHRDVKPGNLLLSTKGVVKILDLGLASFREPLQAKVVSVQQKEDDKRDGLTDNEHLLGTFDYMAPEQAEDASKADQRSDIYSLGCTLFRLLTGRVPYSADQPMKKIIAHRESPLPSLREMRAEVTFDLEKIFHRMIAKKPGNRYQSMAEVLKDLESCAHGRTLGAAHVTPFMADPSGEASTAWHTKEPSTFDDMHLRAAEETIRIEVPKDDDDDFGLSEVTAPVKPKRYYWQVMGQHIGPLTKEQLLRKHISPDDLVRLEDSPDWHSASDMPGLFE